MYSSDTCTGVLVVTVSIAAGLLVMVSSELVVLLIVCVGINTGSALQPGEPVLTKQYMHCHKVCKNHTKTANIIMQLSTNTANICSIIIAHFHRTLSR